jgi:hypothetical protein
MHILFFRFVGQWDHTVRRLTFYKNKANDLGCLMPSYLQKLKRVGTSSKLSNLPENDAL